LPEDRRRLFHPCFAARLGGVSGGKESQGWRDSSHTAMVGAGKFGSAKLPMATQQLIPPGDRWRPILKIDQPAATLWFHPHPHHDTARQIYMGLTGMIIVDDGTDARLGLPRAFGIDDLPLILQDRSFASDGSIEYETDGLDIVYGARGDTVIVNGVIAPLAKIPPGLVRLRLLNAANAQNFQLRFSDQRTFHVIASDGGFLPAPVAVTNSQSRLPSVLRSSSISRMEKQSHLRPARMKQWECLAV
jgi:FtsP/CotA-like multicopper oxidase with cupredoxin domain